MLDPQDARLRDILRWLTTPARCGFYFSHADIARFGGQPGVRGGVPASRSNALEQAIRGAALDDRVSELFLAIRAEMEAHLKAYEKCETPSLTPWIERARASIAVWDEIGSTWQAHLEQLGDQSSDEEG